MNEQNDKWIDVSRTSTNDSKVNLIPKEELFTGIEVNGVRFRNVSEMLQYMNKQRVQLSKAKELLNKWVELFKPKVGNIPPTPIQMETEQFLKECE